MEIFTRTKSEVRGSRIRKRPVVEMRRHDSRSNYCGHRRVDNSRCLTTNDCDRQYERLEHEKEGKEG